VSDIGAIADANSEVSGAASVNLRGDVVGQEILHAGPHRAFVWRDGQAFDLGTLGGLSATAHGINLFDFVAGTAERADNTEHAVLWRLNPALALSSVHAIDLGTFGGNAMRLAVCAILAERNKSASAVDIPTLPRDRDSHAAEAHDGYKQLRRILTAATTPRRIQTDRTPSKNVKV
jgi:probable HAF family extracellular repeat protein